MKWISIGALVVFGTALAAVGLFMFLPLPLWLGPFLAVVPVFGVWIFDCMIQLRWMYQRELAMALGVTMRRNAPILPVLEGNPLAEKPPMWKEILAWFFPYPFYAPLYAWRFGLRASLLRAIDRARAGDPNALIEPGLLHPDDLLDIEMDRLVPGLDPARLRGGRLRAEIGQASVQAVYPILVVMFTLAVACFWMVFIAPKIRRIHSDLEIPYPWLTGALEVSLTFLLPILFIVLLGLLFLAALCWFYPGLSWRLPVLGGVISTWGRGRLLEALGYLIKSGKDLPSALEALQKPNFHGRESLARLRKFSALVGQGNPTPSALRQARWIDLPQEAWLALATRSGRFGDALVELGGSLQSLSLRRLRWRATLLSTLGILGLGILVGLVVVAFFIPLVEMMEWLGR